MTSLTINKKSTKIYGLSYEPDLEPQISNDQDYLYAEQHPYRPTNEVSERNLEKLKEIFIQKKEKCKAILEIGVCRNGERSMTHVFLKNKNKDTIYLGVDLEDKTFLNDENNKIYTVKSNSHNQEIVRQKLKNIGVDKITILMIDGWHSVNTVINDWMYADLLDNNGIVIFHDTNTHPGPITILDAINKDKFKVTQFFKENLDDQGMSIAEKI